MISVTLVGDRELIARLTSLSDNLHRVLAKRVYGLTLKLRARVQRKLSGEVLNVRTGALRRSIQSEVEDTQHSVTGRVFSTGDVKYAAIHEFGGVINHPGGTPYFIKENGMAMFVRKDSMLAATLPKTRPHQIHMPERSYLRSSFAEMQDEIRRSLTEGVLESAVDGGRE